MSPEVVRGDAAGPPADVYGLGVILYQLLTGEPPYRGAVFEILARIQEGNPRPPSALRPGVGPALDAVCLRAMAVDPAARYPSTKAVADELAVYLRGRSGGLD